MQALRAGELAALEMRRITTGLENVLTVLSAAPVVQNFDAKGCGTFLARVSRNLPEFAGISVADNGGTIICRKEARGIGTSIADRPYFQQVMKSGRFVLGGFIIGRVTGIQVLPMAVPIRLDDGTIAGAVIGALDLRWLGQRLRDRQFAHQSALTIADSDGVIIAREPEPERFVGTKIPDAFQKLVNADRAGTQEVTSQDGTQRIIGYSPVNVPPIGLYISAGISTAEAYQVIDRTTTVSVLITILGLAAAYLVAWLTSTQLVHRPVGRLVSTIRAWRAGDMDARASLGQKEGEFGLVGDAIDEFLDELVASRTQRQKDEEQRELLVGELDHRVKNILALVQEVARQTLRSGELTTGAIRSFEDRLNAMADAHRLLMSDGWQAAKLEDLVATAVKPFDRPEASALTVSGPEVAVPAKAALALGMALHELCTNAAKYGALRDPRGCVDVTWCVSPGDDGEPWFRFNWAEHGGPPVEPPQRTGFGSRMIERALAADLGAAVELEYAVTGLRCTLTAPFFNLTRG